MDLQYKDPKYRSAKVVNGLTMAGPRAHLRGMGLTNEELAKPFIGVINTSNVFPLRVGRRAGGTSLHGHGYPCHGAGGVGDRTGNFPRLGRKGDDAEQHAQQQKRTAERPFPFFG